MFLILQDHNIVFMYPEDRDIEDTEIGKWLDDNLIEYRIHKFKKIYDLQEKKNYINIVQMRFYEESDIIAFKLTWTNQFPKPIVI